MIRFAVLSMMILILSGCVATVPPAVQVETAQPAEAVPAPVINLSAREQVYFDADSTIITPATWKTLESVAQVVRMNKALHIHLIGRTDQTQNVSLALRRAIAVRNALSQLGLNPERISVQDESQSDTLLARQSPETKRDTNKSRRVDIVVETMQGENI